MLTHSQASQFYATALRSLEGLKLEEERVDRAYEYGFIGKLERWSRKKLIRQEIDVLIS
jgi:hypothetical protein